MTSLRFDVANHRSRTVEVHWVYNAGHSGRDDPAGRTSAVAYRVEQLTPPWE